MAKTALNSLQDQIEAIRREAYAAGYAAAMQSVRDLVSKAAPGAAAASTPVVRRRRGPQRARAAEAAPAAAAAPAGRRGRKPAAAPKAAAKPAAKPARATARRPQRGTNARFVEEVLQANAPRALRPAEIRSTIQKDKGVSMAFTSIRHALGQLEARQAAEQVGDSKTWRLTAGGSGSN